MRKFIKINLIILVILGLSFQFTLFNIYTFATEESESVEKDESSNLETNEENVQEEQIEEEKDMDTLQLEKSELENNLEFSNAQVEYVRSELTDTVAEIAEINQKINDKQMEITTLEAQEVDLLAYLEKAERELEKSNQRYEKQKSILEKRLVAMYEMGQTSYISLILNSKGIMEVLSNYYLIQEISKSDNELLDSVDQEKKYNKELAKNLETKKLILEVSRETREKNAISLSNMAIIKNSKLAQLSESEIELQQAIEEYQNQITEIETEIRLLAIKNIGEEYVGGTMAWPVPGYTRITSPFGMRTHPITGVYKLHTGTDIGAPMGATFVAANDGVVTYAGWNNAYGNMVIVDHGGGITTLYAHGSQILVEVGQTVIQNTPVLLVGSTGYSTGAHAHFEVRINGEYVDPLQYITSYSSTSENVTVVLDDKNQVANESKNEVTNETKSEK